jgi:integrase
MLAKLTQKQINQSFDALAIRQTIQDTEIKGFSLRRKANGGSWFLDYKIDGKRSRMKLGDYPAMTPTEARNLAKDRLSKVYSGTNPLEQKRERIAARANTLKAYLETHYQAYLDGRKSGKETRQMIDRHFSKELKLSFTDLTKAKMDKWQLGMIDKGLHDETIKRVYGAFKSMLNYAVKHDHVKANPIASHSLKNIRRDSQGVKKVVKRRYLTPEEIKRLKTALIAYENERRAQRDNSIKHGKPWLKQYAENEYFGNVRPFLLLMLYTGLRPSDLRSLKWSHIQFSPWGTTLTKVLEKTAHHKTVKAFTAPLTPEAVEVLTKWGEQNGKPENGLVFSNDGEVLSKWFYRRPWKRIIELAELPDDIEVYSLRHSFASHLIMGGADPLTVASLLGHSDVQMIIEHYAHLSPKHKLQAIQKGLDSMNSKELAQ